MARVERILPVVIGVACAGLALAAIHGWRGSEASLAAAAHDAPSGIDADLARFREGLDRFRRGDEGALIDLRSLADSLCAQHRRCDARDVLGYYAALKPADRQHGFEAEGRVFALQDEARRARRENIETADWSPLRDRMVHELREIVRLEEDRPDFIPAARAASFCARLEIEQIDTDPRLAPDEQELLLEAAENDACLALAWFERAGMLTPRLEPLWIQGRIDAARSRTDVAHRSFEDLLGQARRVGDRDYQEHALLGIIRLAKEAGDHAEMERRLDELAAFRRPKDCWLLVRNHAELLLQRDRPRQAVEFLSRYPPADVRERLDWHMQLGSALFRAGDVQAAREHYAAERDLSWSPDVRLAMATLELREGRPAGVADQLEREGAIDEQPTTLGRVQALRILGEARVRLRRFEEAVDPLERALALSDRWQTRLEDQRESRGAATSVFGEQVGLQTLAWLAQAQASLGHDLEAARVIECYQSHTLRRANSGVDLRGDDRSSEAMSFNDENLLEWAHTFENGLVTWVIGADSSVVAHVASDGNALALPIARGRRDIQEAVRRLREAAVGGDSARLARIAGEVRDEILPREIQARIFGARAPSAGRVLFLLHGPLESLPIELLEVDGRPIDERITPLVLPGLPAVSPGAAWSAADMESWSILGSPVDEAGAARLPGARAELDAVAALHPGCRAVVDREFDRARVLDALSKRSSLHVATHLKPGLAADEDRYAGIGLELSGSDVLSAREIRAAHPRLPLAVLAACETGGGAFIDAEGLQGVARAFLESGTRNLLVTTWPVEDQAARAFAIELHRALIAGQTPSRAAARARAALRARGLGPADWAAFRLLGRD